MTFDMELINTIICCPRCKKGISLAQSMDAKCNNCSERYPWIKHSWNLIPSTWRQSSDLWPVWDHLQENGIVAYREDPVHNLQVGERADSNLFSRFCQFNGLVLDIGCGPQAWPSHFRFHSSKTQFIGVDPLTGETEAAYMKIHALGEYLPFLDDVFDQVVFATSLEHIIDPVVVLREAHRVCKPDGVVNIWIGEKRPTAPKPPTSPAWYRALKTPQPAEDPFHLKRLNAHDVEQLAIETQSQISKRESHPVDPHRINHFFQLKQVL